MISGLAPPITWSYHPYCGLEEDWLDIRNLGSGASLLLANSGIIVKAHDEAQDVCKLFELPFACVWVLSLMREDAAFTSNRSAVGSLALAHSEMKTYDLKYF